MPEKISLSTNLINGVLQYLGTKPFAEVSQLIQAILSEAAPQDAPEADAE